MAFPSDSGTCRALVYNVGTVLLLSDLANEMHKMLVRDQFLDPSVKQSLQQK